MTTELMMLAYTTALLLLLIVIQASVGTMAQGLTKMAGPRDDLGPPTVFQLRTKRVVDNHREGLLIFAPLILILALSDISTGTTALAAQVFFYSRVLHAILYLAAVPWVRPVPWAIGIVACIFLFVAVFSGGA